MPIYTCDYCHYTFEYNADSPLHQPSHPNQSSQPDLRPFRCPDCGRTTVFISRPGNTQVKSGKSGKSSSTQGHPGITSAYPIAKPAIRPATKAEIADYWKYKNEYDAVEANMVTELKTN